MKVIIFNDKQNFDGSLNLLNKRFTGGKRRFWLYEEYIPFLINKIKSFDNLSKIEPQLVKTLFYSGRYSSKLINSFKWSCYEKMAEINALIKKEKNLLDYVSQPKISHELRRRITNHFNDIKETLEKKKLDYLDSIEKQKRNYEGQKALFENIKRTPFIEIKTTPLKQSEGRIYQKGVDVMIATDLVHLAHTDAYNIALILGGDTDLIESIKLIRSLGKIVVICAFYTEGDPLSSTISDLMGVCDHFINLRDLTNEEIMGMSDLISRD